MTCTNMLKTFRFKHWLLRYYRDLLRFPFISPIRVNQNIKIYFIPVSIIIPFGC